MGYAMYGSKEEIERGVEKVLSTAKSESKRERGEPISRTNILIPWMRAEDMYTGFHGVHTNQGLKRTFSF